MKKQQEPVQQQRLDLVGQANCIRQPLHLGTQQTEAQSQMNNEREDDGTQYLWKYQHLLQSRRNGVDVGEGTASFTTQIKVSSQKEQQLREEIECHRKEKEQLQAQFEKLEHQYKQILLIHSAGQIQNKVENTPKKLKIERATSELIISQSDLGEEVGLKRHLSKPNEDISLILTEKQIQYDLLISKHKEQESELTAFKQKQKDIQNRLEEVVRVLEAKEKEILQYQSLLQTKDQQISSLSICQQTVQSLQIQLQSTNEQLKEVREKHTLLNTKYQLKKRQCIQLATKLQIAINKDEITKISNQLADAKKQNIQTQAALKKKQEQIKLLEKDILNIKQQLRQAQKQVTDLQNDLKSSQEANFNMNRELTFAEEKARCKENQLKDYKARDQLNETVSIKNKRLQQALRECQNKLKSAEEVARSNRSVQEVLREYQDKIKAAKQENMEYLTTLQKSQQQKSQLLQQLTELQNLSESTMKENKTSKLITNQAISQKRQMENQILEQKKRLNQLETTLTNERKKTAQYQATINDQTRINNENIQKINSLEAAVKTKDNDLSKQDAVIKTQTKAIEESASNLKKIQTNLKVRIKQLEDSLKNKETDLTKKIETIKTQLTTLESLQNKNKKLQANLKAKQNQIQSKQKELKDQQKTIKSLKQQNEETKILSKKMKETLEKSIDQLKKEKQNSEQYINRVEQQLATLEKQKANIQKKLETTLGFIKTVEKQVLCQDIVKLQNLTDKDIELVIDRLNGLKYFPDSQILSNSPVSKHRFLCQNLKRFLKVQTFQTKLIYKYPTLDTTNFHTYFDNKNNLAIMVKLANGTIIGGFTVSPFVAERVPNGNRGQGFLFSLTAEKAFKMRSDPRQSITTYDHFFLILGNAEIRLRAGEKKVFSNFGIATSTFDNAGYPRTSFLGVQDQTNNELDIESYEIFQVLMERGG